MWVHLISVMAGGALGSALRFLVGAAVASPPGAFPWGTFTVNILGSFVLGVMSGLAVRYDVLSRTTLLFLGTGLCGGFTTFSTFSLEGLALIQAGHVWIFAAYAGGSLVGGLAAAALGIGVVRVSWS